MEVKLIQQTPDPVRLIAQIASVCYDSNPKNPDALVKRLYMNGHHSVFEHVWFTFKIEGISRACSHQLVRHRMCSFTQRSQRYCSEDGFGYVTPPSIERIDSWGDYGIFMDQAERNYNYVQEGGAPNEDARYLLPNACKTSLYLSCNLRELIHMCNERMCMRAQWEIRDLVNRMASLVDDGLKFMLVPRCKAPYLNCCTPCGKASEENGGK